MAKKGLSIPVVANYLNNDDGTVTYSDPITAGKAVEYSVSVEAADSNPLYGDNTIVENDKGAFAGGELSLTTSDVSVELAKKILGIKEVEITLPGQSEKIKELVYDEDRTSPYVGFGIIEEHQVNDITKYRAIILTKVFFNIGEDTCSTRGESIEWNTPEITATIQRSDENSNNYKHPWKKEAWFTTEADAKNYLMFSLGANVPSAE